jgi:hypothetical protein
MMQATPSFIQRLLLPGFAFKAIVSGGGYATGRKLAQRAHDRVLFLIVFVLPLLTLGMWQLFDRVGECNCPSESVS